MKQWARVLYPLTQVRPDLAFEINLPHLVRWANLTMRVQTTQGYPSWRGCAALIEAARVHLLTLCSTLQNLLIVSERRLTPLEDPLTLQFELHRWLQNDREESYSDWLAWLFNALGTPELIWPLLFGESPPSTVIESHLSCTAEREVSVPEGHEGQSGRLDCVLRFGNQALIVIEVKLGRAEFADTAKQAGYSNWLNAQDVGDRRAVLIVTDSEEARIEQFSVLRWRDFCSRGRQLLPLLVQNDRVVLAALFAALLGA